MKKFFAVLALVTVGASMAHAGNGNSGGDGCGLGWQIFDKKTLVGTFIRGTTNSVVPPSFGMTTGTIGCDQHPIAMNNQEAVQYVAANYESLMIEAAQGNGEYVTAFGATLNCGSSEFGALLQKNYKALSTVKNAADFVGAVKGEMTKANLCI
ncbi:MAG: DUF3015 family protein [Bdellovibrionota bacterium]